MTLFDQFPDTRLGGQARVDAPATSKAAADTLSPLRIHASYGAILEVLALWRGGLTDQQMQTECDMSGDTQRPRRGELAKHGLVAKFGKRTSRSGREVDVWRITPAGMRALSQWRGDQ